MARQLIFGLCGALTLCALLGLGAASEPSAAGTSPVAGRTDTPASEGKPQAEAPSDKHTKPAPDYWSLLFVFAMATFIGLGVILRVSRLLHTPLMSLTNAISAIAVVGAILVAGGDYPIGIRILGAIALFASMTNIVSGFLITDRMLRMFKQTGAGGKS
jgi:H+-translocating NAD(P) transhydrogenase subunit alpha